MHWIQILFETDKVMASTLESALTEHGALAVTLLDAKDQPLFEPDPGDTPLWDTVRVTGLFEAETDSAQIIQALKTQLDSTLPQHKIEILEDKDWIKAWMDQYEPIQFGEKLWICPTWHQPPDPSAANIMLDPGLAFGTGTHATTALCLKWLGSLKLQNKSMVDYGCGSGILAVGALLLGCDKAWATDIDPQALQATANNAQQNNIEAARIEICLPDQLTIEATDIVVANILAGPLTNLASAIANLVKNGGQLALSGILVSQIDQVVSAYQEWFEFSAPVEMDGWVLLTANKKG